MITDLALIGLLLLCLFFFSSAETALVAVSKPLMHQLEIEGTPGAALVNRLQQRRERMIGSILLGNTLVQILASAIATSLAIQNFGTAGVAYGSVAMTVVVLVFCEILPKTLALNYARQAALAVAPSMLVIVRLFGPFAMAVQALVHAILRLFGLAKVQPEDLDVAMAELRGVIDIHAGEEGIKHERRMLRSILDLDDVGVGEIMIHRKNVVMLDAGQPIADIVRAAVASPYTRLPLWHGEPDNIVGVLHTKALLRAFENDKGEPDITKLASAPWFIPESTSLLDQLQAFRLRREHFAFVVDEYGVFLGIVTLEDIIEEIVGDISDELDVLAAGVRAQPDGSYVVNGDVTIRDLNREFDWSLPDEHAATVAGLLLHETRTIPEAGQAFRLHGFRFEVLRRQRNQITSVRITPPLSEETIP